MEEYAEFLGTYEYTKIKNSNLIYKCIDEYSLKEKKDKLLFVKKAFEGYQEEKTLSKFRICILELDYYVNDNGSFQVLVVKMTRKRRLLIVVIKINY